MRPALVCAVWLLLQALLLVGGGSWAAQLWGVSSSSPLWGPACDFLSIRAAGAPVTVLLLVMQVGWEGAGTRHQRLQPSVTYQLTATHWCDGLTGTIQRRNPTIYVVARAG